MNKPEAAKSPEMEQLVKKLREVAEWSMWHGKGKMGWLRVDTIPGGIASPENILKLLDHIEGGGSYGS